MSETGRKVLVVVITKDRVEPACWDSLIAQDYPDYNILVHIAKPKKYFTNPENPSHEAFVNQYINCPENRNHARKLALASDADFFMMVDADTVLPTYAISRLMLHKKDIVGGYYLINSQNDVYVAGGYQMNSKKEPILLHCKAPLPKGLLPVDLVGLGCALLSRKVLEAVEFEDGLNLHNLAPDGSKPAKFDPPRFDQVKGQQIELSPQLEEPKTIMMGECGAFVMRAKQKGFQAFMDEAVQVIEHINRPDHYTNLPKTNQGETI